MSFNSLGLSDALLKAISKKGYTTPSPIQKKAIPPILEGKDVLASAQTGTGKTAGFTLPILQILSQGKHLSHRPIRALILTPTRELAAQILANIKEYSEFVDLRSAVIFGGVNQNPQVAQLRQGIDILVATPGRLIDLQNQGLVTLSKVEILVLDEADRMLDMGFYDDIMRIIHALPQKRQNLLFSATMPHKIRELARTILHKPEEVSISISKPNEKITQLAYVVYDTQKIPLVKYILHQKNFSSVLIFCSSKISVKQLTRDLKRTNLPVDEIHSDLEQDKREEERIPC